MIAAESNFNPRAVSAAAGAGLMQLADGDFILSLIFSAENIDV